MFKRIRRVRNRLKYGLEELVYPAADAAYNWLTTRKKYRLLKSGPPKSGLNLTHVAFFGHYNAGDTLLPVVLRDLYDRQLGRSAWNKQ
ncbi:MAG: hypothetical protein KDC85_19105, partial [Saprospiraceae bacterium]|nr:hypothetical protein [Saprospiraceae bacterium]